MNQAKLEKEIKMIEKCIRELKEGEATPRPVLKLINRIEEIIEEYRVQKREYFWTNLIIRFFVLILVLYAGFLIWIK